MRSRILFLVVLSFAVKTSQGYPPSHCPFEPNEFPASKVVRCKAVYEQRAYGKELFVYVSSPTIITIQRTDPNGPFTASMIENGKVLFERKPLVGSAFLGLSVWVGDLTSDDDGHQDFIIRTAHNGNGLAAYISFAHFFLRTHNHCRTFDAISYTLDANDFVDLDNDGRVEWIQTEFIRGVAGKDKKVHNYWVMNLIHFRDGLPILANSVDKRFPSWIWYTYKPNHTNTTQLSNKQKKELFKKQAIGLDIYSR